MRKLFCAGFTLVELLVVVGILGIITLIAVPKLFVFYRECGLKSAANDIVAMIREAKARSLSTSDHAVIFDIGSGRVILASGKGHDDRWNTPDDTVIRLFRLAEKGGDIRFGHGQRGPIAGSAVCPDGVSFQNNIVVCNEDLSGSAGTVYLQNGNGGGIAISVNSIDVGYKIYRWDGTRWERL